MKKILSLLLVCFSLIAAAQHVQWSKDGNSFYRLESGNIIQYTLPSATRAVFVAQSDLKVDVSLFLFSGDQSQLLIFTNTQKVWRLHTRGDYWVMNLKTKSLKQLGKTLPPSSLMFAKFSPDGTHVAYSSGHNIYSEDLATGEIKALTKDGTNKLINGTFDWVYEEEFACRDGFQWSPDSRHIAFWQVDANKIRDFYMINNTDSVYSRMVPVEYPTIGQSPSPVRIGIVSIDNDPLVWLKIPGDPAEHYLPRMEWNSPTELFVQQFNRKQNESRIFVCNPASGEAKQIHSEADAAWIDIYSPWQDVYALDFRHKFKWLNKGKEFLWVSEKNGWRQLYRISRDGTQETLITKGNYDVMDVQLIDEANNTVYFMASPENATQKYLYKTRLDGKGNLEKVTPSGQEGTHDYDISPNGKFAFHSFSNHYTKPMEETISLPLHKALIEKEGIAANIASAQEKNLVEFFKVKTEEGVEMDAWVAKPKGFDPSKKYPVLFFVYTEPWGANVHDSYGTADNPLFDGDLASEGYLYITVDNRGTPVPKGSAWRKCVYRKIGRINIRDQALAAKEILKWPYVDASRVAVWGWSGGGAATLNLLFQYPDIYKTGIAVSAVTNQLTYDNIYQERYMGLPKESMDDIIAGSPMTYAKNLKGNLLYIHGTGDDNVHYCNAEMLINELVKYNKQFQFMAYPNRTHSISEGAGTTQHLSTLYSSYLRKHCPPGPK